MLIKTHVSLAGSHLHQAEPPRPTTTRGEHSRYPLIAVGLQPVMVTPVCCYDCSSALLPPQPLPALSPALAQGERPAEHTLLLAKRWLSRSMYSTHDRWVEQPATHAMLSAVAPSLQSMRTTSGSSSSARGRTGESGRANLRPNSKPWVGRRWLSVSSGS